MGISEEYFKKYQIFIKTPEQISKIRRACKLAAEILEKICAAAKVGVTTNQLNALAEKYHREARAIAAPLNYGSPPFPKSICTSINEVVCHGIPNDSPLKEGDILNIDVSPILEGFYGDCSRMVVVGKVSEEKKKLVRVTKESLDLAIALLKPGVNLTIIGQTIEAYAQKNGFSVVRQFVGHGVGLHFHEAPQVCHFANNLKIPLVPGMTFTIEPMINAGTPEVYIDPKDGWVARTRDGKASAQWEHTVLITDTGCEILTL